MALTNLASLKQIIEDDDAVETDAFTLNRSRRSLPGLPAWKRRSSRSGKHSENATQLMSMPGM
ncbi:hypothetical protein ASE60_30055 [Ensifer sp. Root278]|nr:hypothetical protein ASE60_30055 [Ensifer sp. Root278]